MKQITRVHINAEKFENDNTWFSITPRPRRNMNVWTLHKSFRRIKVKYRVLSDLKNRVPVGIQRLTA